MRIDIQDLQDNVVLDKRDITKCAKFVLNKMGEASSELSLAFVSDLYIRKLNRRYRNIDSKTDVLAFSMREGWGFSKKSLILGDVVVSAETAKKEAKERKIPLYKEMRLYVVHGILHLLGYDDETPSDRKKMKAKEIELLEAM